MLRHTDKDQLSFDIGLRPPQSANFGGFVQCTSYGRYLIENSHGDANRALERSVRLMESVGSREIYQAYFNRAINNGLQGNYQAAMDDFARADEFTPAALLLDSVKIEMARAVFELVSGEIDSDAALIRLNELVSKIKGVQLPYLRRSLDHNIAKITDPKTSTSSFIKDHIAGSKRVRILHKAGLSAACGKGLLFAKSTEIS